MMLENLTTFLNGIFLLNKVDSLHGGRLGSFLERIFKKAVFILNRKKIMKLVNIFICPEFDLIQKSRCFTMDQKGVKRAKNNTMNYRQ